jgi:hypothetical protein
MERHGKAAITLNGDLHRVMMFDDINKRFIGDKSIEMLLRYEVEM